MSGKVAYVKKSVTSKDCTTIGFRQLGRGPAIVILDYSIEREDEDLAAVVAETGAQAVIADQLRQFFS